MAAIFIARGVNRNLTTEAMYLEVRIRVPIPRVIYLKATDAAHQRRNDNWIRCHEVEVEVQEEVVRWEMVSACAPYCPMVFYVEMAVAR